MKLYLKAINSGGDVEVFYEPTEGAFQLSDETLVEKLYAGKLRLFNDNTELVEVEEEKPEEEQKNPIEILQQENKLLKAQTQMQSEQITFLEECILEMAEVVYA